MTANLYKPLLTHLRSFLAFLPEGTEVEAWGHPTFRAGKKMFAACGHEHTDLTGLSMGIRVGFDRQDELLDDPRFFPTPYAAHQGWVSLRIDDSTDWEEVRALFTEAYRTVANKRMLTALEAQAGGHPAAKKPPRSRAKPRKRR